MNYNIMSTYFSLGLVLIAVKSVSQQDRFHLPSPNSSAMLTTASKLSDWMKDSKNNKECHEFCEKLVKTLRECFIYQRTD